MIHKHGTGVRSCETMPKDGDPFEGRVINIYRWKAYKPQARKQMNKAGRGQQMNSYGGWINCTELPSDWRPHPLTTGE